MIWCLLCLMIGDCIWNPLGMIWLHVTGTIANIVLDSYKQNKTSKLFPNQKTGVRKLQGYFSISTRLGHWIIIMWFFCYFALTFAGWLPSSLSNALGLRVGRLKTEKRVAVVLGRRMLPRRPKRLYLSWVSWLTPALAARRCWESSVFISCFIILICSWKPCY